MCVWGHCVKTDTTRRCRFCGTKICTACLRGDFFGVAPNLECCIICHSRGNFLEKLPNVHARTYTAEHLADLKRQKGDEKTTARAARKRAPKKASKKAKKRKIKAS